MAVPSLYRFRLSLVPLLGIGLFLGLYGWATVLYPGGSNAHPTAVGFNWLTNYWCDLTGEIAKNGQANPAAPVATVAMLVLCVSLAVFWLTLPRLFTQPRQLRTLMQYPGVTAMLVAPFVASAYHDAAINLTGILALPPFLLTLLGLYQGRYVKLLAVGGICLLLVLLNNVIYHLPWHLNWLPVVQKFTFLAVLGWISAISWRVYVADLQINK
ncbi:hypothetical protein J2I47_18375 [Fibrella sp. HMF5335]|uniref:DUF998 domain-containing protein n=1 Tax=Fibrella rubiginis TaxID=2817060 RepID=A0A939GGE2_9BACT|nr:hypothetical protein [Fibrella rubiginis]MBO0938524.1 hypothetical protein [Fibrella rubiginis]